MPKKRLSDGPDKDRHCLVTPFEVLSCDHDEIDGFSEYCPPVVFSLVEGLGLRRRRERSSSAMRASNSEIRFACKMKTWRSCGLFPALKVPMALLPPHADPGGI
jgi:hypothetical protein